MFGCFIFFKSLSTRGKKGRLSAGVTPSEIPNSDRGCSDSEGRRKRRKPVKNLQPSKDEDFGRGKHVIA